MTSQQRKGIKFRHLQDKSQQQQQQHKNTTSTSEQSEVSASITMPTHSSLLLLVTCWASIQDGSTLSALEESRIEASDVSAHHVRTKRCACSNQLDSECHYFCHLDIIWINTPGKTTTYGLGGSLLRRRRSTARCTCANSEDQACTTFCHLRPEIKPLKRPQLNIFSILRTAASRLRAQNLHPSATGETSGPERENA